MHNLIPQVAEWLRNASMAIGFTGAGISTDSGIPDFRSPTGIWATSQPVYFEEFLRSPDARHEYWRQKAASHRDFASAKPNSGHQVLAAWQQSGRLRRLLTQNIDGLHQIAGNQNVLELHGTARFIACLSCSERFEAGEMVEQFLRQNEPPNCPQCGGLLKHATVSFGQSLPESVLQEAVELSEQSDLFLSLGSSLVVQPAASLPRIARNCGARLVIVNREPTPLDAIADVVIRMPLSETLVEVNRLMLQEP